MGRSRKLRSSQLRGIGLNEIDYADGCDRFVASYSLPAVEVAHPVAGVLLTMPVGLLAGLHRALGSSYIALADAMETQHAAAKVTAALNQGSKAHGINW